MNDLAYPDGLPKQLDDRGSDSWCSRHGRIPWAMDGICNACECYDDEENAVFSWDSPTFLADERDA